MHSYIARLQDMLGTENVFTDRASIVSFCAFKRHSSESVAIPLPLAVIRPRHDGHIRELIKLCGAERLHLQIRGSGTSGINPPYPENTLLLLTTGMDRILDLDVENRIACIQSGVSVTALNSSVGRHGLYYPHQIFPESPATVGGQIAANLPDAHTYKFGPPSNLVEELEVYLSTGDRYRLTCQNEQSISPTLPVAPLFCGSRGLLGLIGGLKIRLLPLPKKLAACLLSFTGIQDAISASTALITSGLTPDTFEILDKEASIHCDASTSPILYMTFSDIDSCDLANAFSNLSCTQTFMDEKKNRNFLCKLGQWQIRLQSQAGTFLHVHSWVPQSHLSSFVENMLQICTECGVKTAFSIHAGLAFIDILLHSAPQDRLKLAAQKLFALELMLNNRMTDENEAVLDRKAWEKLHAEDMKLSKDLARCFDPAGMFSSPLF